MFYKLKKRCRFCAHVLKNDKTCRNPNCIVYKIDLDATAPNVKVVEEQEKADSTEDDAV